MKVPVPPPAEQAGIVRVLEAVDRRVNRLVRAKRRLLGLLAEQKQAVITHAVTRGLDPHAPTKSSGVPWLGDVPQHWETRRIKYLFREVDSRSVDGGETHLSMSQRMGLVPSDWLQDRRLRSESYAGGKLVQVNDLVLNRLKAHLGVFRTSLFAGVISPDYSVFRPIRPLNMPYFEMVLRTPLFRPELRRRVRGVVEGFWRLYTDDFYDFRVPCPPLEEQQAIVRRLDNEAKEVLAVVTKTEREIDLIREYRTRLVADVVTGKLDVRGFDLEQPQVIETKPKANICFQRSVFAAEIVHRLHEEITFGHVKCEKLIFLCEERCGVDTGSTYRRQAAGPYDNRALRSIDAQLKKQKWYEAKKGEKGYRYVALENAGGHAKYFTRYFQPVSDEFERIITRFRTATTQQCEIVATLYSAWNDLLDAGSPTDDSIIDQVLEHWHVNKKKIDESTWRTALAWMKAKDIVPKGA